MHLDSRDRACAGIVPPYLLQHLLASGDPHLAEHARRTLVHDSVLRARPVHPGPRRAVTETAGPHRTIHDGQHRTALPGAVVLHEGDQPVADEAVDQAYDGLGATWHLYHEVFGRDSVDGNGLPLVATVHYDRHYDNAFWNGSQMVFGDGDGTVFLGFTGSLDVIGHELTHGVTESTARLTYSGQPGALNESVSDVFGSLVKQRALGQTADEADWLIGADLLAPGVKGVGLRSLKAPGTAYDDPRLGKDPQPADMAGYVSTTDDNGGVHINSGIPNRAFQLVATALGGPAWEAPRPDLVRRPHRLLDRARLRLRDVRPPHRRGDDGALRGEVRAGDGRPAGVAHRRGLPSGRRCRGQSRGPPDAARDRGARHGPPHRRRRGARPRALAAPRRALRRRRFPVARAPRQ